MARRTDEKKQSGKMAQAMDQLNDMMAQGRSFSGNERNCCFLNTPNGRFATASAVSGLDFPDDGRAVAAVDWDQDGDLDLWITNRNAPRLRFMCNNGPRTHHFLRLNLQGNGITCNRDAIGARVEVVAKGMGGNRLIRTLRAGEGMLSQSSKWLHFGLGKLREIDKVIVHWPNGKAEEFTGIDINGHYHLVQDSGTAKSWSAPNGQKPDLRKLKIKPADQIPELFPDSVRIPLVPQASMPRKSSYLAFDGSTRQLDFRTGKSTLIVLFASWCLPCRKELSELAQRHKQMRSAGIDVVALAVDGLGKDGSNAAAAQKLCEHLKIPFPAGRAQLELTQLLTGYHHMVVALIRPLPVPTSFLVDRQGRLSVIYKGRVSIDQVLKDAQPQQLTLRQRWQRAACLPGRMIDHAGVLDSLRRWEANAFYAMGDAFAKRKLFEDAAEHFRSALQIEPHFAIAKSSLARVHYNQGNIHMKHDQLNKAIACYREALQRKPDYWKAHMNLGAVLLRQKRMSEAVPHYQEVLKINPGFVPAQRILKQLNALVREPK